MTDPQAANPRHLDPFRPMRIAMVGTRGVPASYGGFETAIEEIGPRLVQQGHDVTVYCRPTGRAAPKEHLGMRLVNLPALRTKALETLSHTALSTGHFLGGRRQDVAFVFNAANAPFVPLIRARGTAVALHVDGLEWKRDKWGRWGRRYYRLAEQLAVREADALIADAQGIAQYFDDEFQVPTELISYGTKHPPQHAERRDRSDRPRTRAVPPRGRAVRTGEPRRRDRGGISPVGRDPPPRRGRLRPVLRRLHGQHRRPGSPRSPRPPPRRGVGPATARPALRACVRATSTGTPSVAPTPRCSAPWAPGRPSWPGTWSSTGRSQAQRASTSRRRES